MSGSTKLTRSSSEVEAAFRGRYRAVQYCFGQFITEHIADCARAFGGDLEQLLVLAVIGQAALESQLPEGKHDNRRPLPRSVNASRISDVCGIPRETVRRKLKILEQKRWIEQADDRSWRIAVSEGNSMARQQLQSLDSRGLKRFARLFARLQEIAPSGVVALDGCGFESGSREPIRRPSPSLAPVEDTSKASSVAPG